MIVLEDYWLLILWYVILACHEPFVNNIGKIIKMCDKEWISKECFNIKDKDRNEFELKLKSKNNDGQILKIRIYAFDLSIY